MTTIPTIDQITGNTVMQKFRSLAKAVIDTLTSFGERTDYIVSDLAPRLEENLQTLSTKLVELNNTLNTTQSLQEQVTALANQVNETLDNIVRKDTPSTIAALLTLASGLAVTGTTTIDGDVQITNGHSMSVAGDVDVANDLDVSGNAIIRGNTEVGGMAIEESSGRTVLSNANGVSMTTPFDVLTTATGVRDTKAVNGTRLQNDLDNYGAMVRTTGNVQKFGIMELMNGVVGYMADWKPTYSSSSMSVGQWSIFAEITDSSQGRFSIIEFIQGSNTSICYGKMLFRNYITSPDALWLSLKNKGAHNPLTTNSIKVISDGTKLYLAWQKVSSYGTIRAREYTNVLYGETATYNSYIKWINPNEMLVVDDLNNYTVYDVIE